jgi:methionine sulfoxide reductase heme-binding subunit
MRGAAGGVISAPMKLPFIRDRVAAFRAAVLLLVPVPGLWVAAAFACSLLGARPLHEAIHQIGLWTLRLAFIALAVTPLRQILRWPQLTLVRRRIGVAAFCYGAVHLCLYTADQRFDLAKVASEIALRIYLTIGFCALLGLLVLAATSTDAMVRRLGPRRWQRLHRLVYPIAVLALIHYFIQSKLDVWEPTVMAGFLFWLLGYRVLARARGARAGLSVPWVAGLGLGAATLTALGETLWFWWLSGADPMRILAVEFSFATGIRPAAIVLLAAIVVAGAALWRAPRRRAVGTPRQTPRATTIAP